MPYVSLDIAKKLKLEGFDLPTLGVYYENRNPEAEEEAEFIVLNEAVDHNFTIDENVYSAPTVEQAFNWYLSQTFGNDYKVNVTDAEDI